ncbi:MAG: carboxy-S-adenosyl-L-methionine synthase CmoA [Desulfuromonas sp.]|nr:MAG: carboxy-S-adenosyl-L-methionine synthase CmoA [Desulfuromonas sp.]
MNKDKIYAEPREPVAPFEFNRQVVEVFDDMLGRSVPLYHESIRRQAQIAASRYQPATRIYDLGCSNGNFGLAFCDEIAAQDFEMVAVDNSVPMLTTYGQRLAERTVSGHIQLLDQDIRTVELNRASVVVINLTLQFLPVADRDALIRDVYRCLVPGGVLLLTEKVVHENAEMNDLEQDFYYRFKAENGYSQMEISQKREALENVLVPESIEVHQQRLQQSGFNAVDVWLKWFNFASILAMKTDG